MAAQGGKQDDMGMAIALGLILAVFLIYVFWHFFHEQILDLVRWIKVGELYLIGIFYDSEWDVANALSAIPSEQLSIPIVSIAAEKTAYYLRWPCAAALLIMAYIRWSTAPQLKFRRKFNLETLMQEQAKMWPVIAPVVKFNPTRNSARIPGDPVPTTLPLFAESLSPEEWIAWATIPINNGQPDRESMRRAFTRQLGPRWVGLKGLQPAERALFAAFALKGAQKRSESDELLGHIASCWNEKNGLQLKKSVSDEIDKILSDSKITQPALAIASRHAYLATALISTLKWAREQGGVLAPAQFVWLRGENRRLWYPLNNLGRKAYHAEAAGAMAHYMAEVNANRRLEVPRVDTAILTINSYLNGDNRPVIPPQQHGEDRQPKKAGSHLLAGIQALIPFKSS